MNKEQFAEYSKQYFASLPSLGKSELTVISYERTHHKFYEWLDNNEEIKPITFVKWRTNLLTCGVKSNTIKTYLIRLHSFFNWAYKLKLINEIPLPLDEIPTEQRREYDLLTLDEIKTILTFTSPGKGLTRSLLARNRAIVVLLIQSGLRNDELRQLKLSDIDFEQNRITVRHGKGDKMRLVPLPAIAKEALLDYLNSEVRPPYLSDDDYLFGTTADGESGYIKVGGKWHSLSSTALLLIIRRYTEKICGHSVKTHALRHAFTSLCDYAGMPLSEISQNLGHANPITTAKIYRHILNKDTAVQSAVTAMNSFTETLSH